MTVLLRRWLPVVTMALFGLGSSGCYVTDWRWIWEEEDDHHCEKVQIQMQPPGMAGNGYSMSVSVPAEH